MPVPNSFANVTTSIPLSQLDANFNTPITLGNTAIQLGNTVSTLNNMTLANVTVTSGNVTITNVTVTTANVTTANITTAIIGTANVTTANVTTGIIGTANVTTGNITTAVITTANVATANITTSQILNYGTANSVVYLNSSKAATANTGLQFDGSNLGLGVTPSAWGASWKSMSFNTVGAVASTTGVTRLYHNAFNNDSNNLYRTTAAASMYSQDGAHAWFTAPSGTAGNAITFTQAMTLDASGNLGVGTSSPNRKLVVDGGSSDAYLKLTTSATASNFASGILFNNTLNSDGNIYIRVNGGESNLVFGTGSSERARITSGGVLLVGTTTGQQNTEIAAFTNAGGGSIVLRIQRSGENNAYIASSTAQPFQVWDSGIVQRFVVTSAGTCLNTTGTYGTLSDAKLKENIVDATPKLDELMKVRVRNYGLKSEPNSKYIGFVAQELREIFPAMIDEAEDEDDKGEKTGEVTLNVKTTVFIPMLVKAIQELNAKVEAQAAEIAALKGNA